MRRLRFVSLAVILALCLSIALLPSQTAIAGPGDYDVPSSLYPKIQTAINAASAAGGGTVNVAAGNYAENIEMLDNVIIQGSGANVTFIDGGGSGSVVKANNVSNAKLDGFTITSGNATISVGGAGGGISLQYNSSANISNCIIIGNSADYYGGGIFVHNSSPIISNCLITGNTAGTYGGGILIFSSSPTVTNCTLTGNSATDGGGMYNLFSNPTITNSIIYGNIASSGPNIFDSSSTPSVTYSCVGGGYSETSNIDADPSFVDPGYWSDDFWVEGDYHLQVVPTLSPCIDAGNNNAPGILEFDLDGNDRKADGNGDTVVTVDMGAYEYQLTNSPPVADAGPDQTVEQTSYEGAEVTLDGTASSDPDDDPLTFSWSAQDISFDDATSSTPTATFPLGTTTVTLMVNDGTVDSDPDTMMVAVLSLHSIKTQAILELESLLPTGEKKVDKKIEKAIEHLEKALDEALWLDDTHLDEKHGAKVFNEEKKTVKELKHLLDKDDTPEGVKDICQSVINKLIEVDKLLATTAYEEAQSGAGYPKVDKELEKCDKELEKAEEELAKGKYDKAIKHYKNAWKHAQKALGKAPEDDE